MKWVFTAVVVCLVEPTLVWADPIVKSISGVYPHLAMFNDEDECGTGAVVPWADRLWVITYAPHKPNGSTDKLYEITPDLVQHIRPESIGGTCANRFIHRESNQLFIGPYVVDAQRNVRVIPFKTMFGRHTGTARHLFKPESHVYTMTMEEGLYEIDVHSLEVNTLYHDEAVPNATPKANLPGYHGKGVFSAQNRLIYANNGEQGEEARKNPRSVSGALAQWDGMKWDVVQRNQFTEVTGPGGIHGNSDPSQPAWSIGWDHKSVLLMCLKDGQWHRWRLPKASNSYDGAHGWNTEWPRIREIGEEDLLMTMHGMFWRFPASFSPERSDGIVPRSRYLKVVGDFCRWQDKIVLGCDDTARSEFLNKRKVKGTLAAPQSQSNLWFIDPATLDSLGPAIANGGVWSKESLEANTVSDSFLANAFESNSLILRFESKRPAKFTFESDVNNDGQWEAVQEHSLAPGAIHHFDLSASYMGSWLRIRSHDAVSNASAWFHCSNPDKRSTTIDPKFNGIADHQTKEVVGGTLRARNHNRRTLHFLASNWNGKNSETLGLYELDGNLDLVASDDKAAMEYEAQHSAIPETRLTFDDASILYIDDNERRWRLPYASPEAAQAMRPSRICREVSTERDLFNAAGIFYELPAENAGGFSKVSPISTHNLAISDFCSFRGLLILSGMNIHSLPENNHVIRSSDNKVAVWAGVADDLWKLGKPRGYGGPWLHSKAIADIPSDPYLMGGFENKSMWVSHLSDQDVTFTIEVDVNGDGDWWEYEKFRLSKFQRKWTTFDNSFSPKWIRVMADRDCTASCQLFYDTDYEGSYAAGLTSGLNSDGSIRFK